MGRSSITKKNFSINTLNCLLLTILSSPNFLFTQKKYMRIIKKIVYRLSWFKIVVYFFVRMVACADVLFCRLLIMCSTILFLHLNVQRLQLCHLKKNYV
jgi:hypothetical protein